VRKRVFALLAVVLGALSAAPTAFAATLSVDDDGQDCPAASFASIQQAVDAADPGDTIAICPGHYAEGAGAPGTSGLTITKSLVLKGAGADLVRISPKRSTATGGQIADEGDFDIADGIGDIVAVRGGSSVPITVDILGVTVDGNGVYSEAGIVYIDAQGAIFRSRVTNVVTSEAAGAYATTPGAWRGPHPGYGIAQVTSAGTTPAGAGLRALGINNVRVDRYNRAGIFIDGNGVVDNHGEVNASEIVGRILCQNFAADGNCSNPGLVTTGPLFGQDGLRAIDGASLSFANSQVTSNLVNGTGAPVRQRWNASGTTMLDPGTAGNENLDEGAGVRLVGADVPSSTITGNNIIDNAFGVINVLGDGTTANPVAVNAPNNWWGLRFTGGGAGSPTPPYPNTGPLVSPAFNPPIPENPVNGTEFTSGEGRNSTAVDFQPFRSGPQGSPTEGQFANVQAPQPMDDGAPTAALEAAPAEAQRGGTVNLTATGTDDFGVKSVTFYDGSTVLGTDSLPPYAQAFTVPADAPCAARTFTAVVEDSTGQTASASDTVTVTGPNNCQPDEEPPPPPPAAPVVTIPVIDRIDQGGTNVTVDPNAPAGVAKVEYFLGNRLVCTVTQAPFTCTVVPQAGDVGLQTLRVVVTDKLGRTVVAERQVLIREFESRGITIRIKYVKVKGNRVRRTITAQLRPPAGMTQAEACADSRMTLVVTRKRRPYSNTQPSLDSNCSVRTRLTSKRAKKRIYAISARFPGNTVLLPTTTSRRFK
jgi:Bacterial Ig domain